MSTANFRSVRNFPLITANTPYCKFCLDCGEWNPAEADTCKSCGADLSNTNAEYDEMATEDIFRYMESRASEINGNLLFHKVTVESGYYCGMQFYVEEKYPEIEELSNEDSNREFGMCRSKMLRKYNSECNRISKELRRAAREMGLDELLVVGRFSNGECVYSRVEGKPTARQAAKAAICAA